MNYTRHFFLWLFVLLPFCSLSQNGSYTLSSDSLVNFHASNRRIYTAVRTHNRPKTDGRLNDECWLTEGEWQGNFIQQTPEQGTAPSQPTEMKILYDDDHLYIALRCYDSEPEKISPILGRRDDFTSGDVVGVALDSYHDKQTAFEFNVTAAGQKIDLIHLGAYELDTNWDAVWEGKAFVGDSAWTAEIKIPFSQLRFSDEREQVWGLHVWRWIDRLDEESQWKLIPIDAPASVYIFGELHGIRDIPAKRHFEMMPYGAFRFIKNGGKSERFGLGLDGKAALSSSFTLDYTFLPDFGQVEADPSELNLSAYEVFYDEKRPFFLEGNAILDYSAGNDMLFYSRRIGHTPSYIPPKEGEFYWRIPSGTSILNALKVTGKNKKGFSLGIINSMTEREFATLKQDQETEKRAVEPFTNYFISRARQDLNGGNTLIGIMATSVLRSTRDDHLRFLPDKATVGGVDLIQYWAGRKYFLDAKSFFSHITGTTEAISKLQYSSQHFYQRQDADHIDPDPAATVMSGWGGQLRGGKQSGKFRATGTMSWRSPGVDLNDAGYLRDADLITLRADLRYQVNNPAGIMLNYYINYSQRHDWTFGRENINNNMSLHGFMKFRNLWNIHLDLVRNSGKIDTRQLRGGPALKTDPYSIAEVFVQTNSAYKLFAGAGVDRKWSDGGVGGAIDYTLYLQWKISNRFSITSHSNLENLIDNNQYITRKTSDTGTKYIVGKIDRKTLYTTLRAEFFVSPELSFQFYGSPYASTGKFRELYKVADSYARIPGNRYSGLAILEEMRGRYVIDENQDGSPDFMLENPDFDFGEFRSNLVLRWEYLAGSTVYLVWSHNRTRYEDGYNPSITDSFGKIGKIKGENGFMLKLSYWFSL